MVKTIILWVLLTSFIIPGLIFGYQKLIGEKQKTELFKRFGYPLWFMHILGLAEIIACLLMLFSPTRIIGILIFPVILAGAVYTHLQFKDPKKEVMTPVFVGVHLLAIFLFTLWM